MTLNKKNNKDCFIITPIGDDGSEIRNNSMGVINAVLRPELETFGYNVIIPHEMSKPGSITNQIITSILESKLVIANLSGLNHNVMYELALRHASRKAVISIAEEGTPIPFDIGTERTIFYKNDLGGYPKLKKDIISAINEIESSDMEIDNPISRALENKIILEMGAPRNKEEILLKKINNIENMLSKINNINNNITDEKWKINDIQAQIPIDDISEKELDYVREDITIIKNRGKNLDYWIIDNNKGKYLKLMGSKHIIDTIINEHFKKYISKISYY